MCYSCCRASLDWKLVINKAAELVEAMAYKTPELKDRMHYPRGRNNLDNAVPVGSRYICVQHAGASFFQHVATCTYQ